MDLSFRRQAKELAWHEIPAFPILVTTLYADTPTTYFTRFGDYYFKVILTYFAPTRGIIELERRAVHDPFAWWHPLGVYTSFSEPDLADRLTTILVRETL